MLVSIDMIDDSTLGSDMTAADILADMAQTSGTYEQAPQPPPTPPATTKAEPPEAGPIVSKPIALPPLQRIPGTVDQGAPKRLTSKGKEYSVGDIIAAARSNNVRTRVAALKVLGSLNGLNRSELHLAAAILYATAHEVAGDAPGNARTALAQMLSAHPENTEALHIAVQITKRSFLDIRFAEAIAGLTSFVTNGLSNLGVTSGMTRRDFIERRHVLLRAFEVPTLRDTSVPAMRSLLEDRSDQFKVERKDLAGNILAAMRSLTHDLPSLKDLKHVASVVFATGVAPAATPALQAVDMENANSLFVTAAQAESRKQYGLAEALEIRRCLTLRNRPMALEEYCIALYFAPLSLGASSNTSWPTRLEWNTMVRLLVLASREEHIPVEGTAGLMCLLATRVKVEDPNDLRGSHKRPDAIPTEEREKLLKESDVLLRRSGLDPKLGLEISTQLAEQLLTKDFSNFVFTPAGKDQPGEFSFGASGESRSDMQARLLSLLLNDDSPAVITRLLPEQIDAIRQVQGLTVDEFKTVTSRLRGRAVTCEWARMAILDLVRAPHHAQVGERVRTAVLGALVNEARRVGKLTPLLEKEVFAVSAEIPALPFLVNSSSENDDFNA